MVRLGYAPSVVGITALGIAATVTPIAGLVDMALRDARTSQLTRTTEAQIDFEVRKKLRVTERFERYADQLGDNDGTASMAEQLEFVHTYAPSHRLQDHHAAVGIPFDAQERAIGVYEASQL